MANKKLNELGHHILNLIYNKSQRVKKNNKNARVECVCRTIRRMSHSVYPSFTLKWVHLKLFEE
jgi:hypothetical protein